MYDIKAENKSSGLVISFSPCAANGEYRRPRKVGLHARLTKVRSVFFRGRLCPSRKSPLRLTYPPHPHSISLAFLEQRTRDKIVVVSGTEEQQREVLLGYMSAEALEGGRLGCPGQPAFDVDSYLKGGDAGGSGDSDGVIDEVSDS